MTVDQLRKILRTLPGDAPVLLGEPGMMAPVVSATCPLAEPLARSGGCFSVGGRFPRSKTGEPRRVLLLSYD